MIKIWEPSDIVYPERELSFMGAGPWAGGFPSGVCLHYTADDSLDNVRKVMLDSHIGYHFIVDRDGMIHQTAYLDQRTNHAGKALWNAESPNRKYISIAILSWGLCPSGMAWTGKKVPTTKRAGQDWDVATYAQEEATLRLLRELKDFFGIPPMNICGHDECALPKGRKVDPGHVLSKTCEELRRAYA